MGRVLTNNSSLIYSVESALETAGSTWYLTEPNSITEFGAEIVTVKRSPISANRQARKGTVVDLNSGVGIETDLTRSSFMDFVEGFVFATATNGNVTNMPVTAVDTTGDTYAVTALTAGQAAKIVVGTLLWAEGFTNAGNNGLKTIDTAGTAADTTLAVFANLVTETPPANAKVSLVGYQIAALDAPTWTYDGSAKTGTLALTGIGTTLTALGLLAGQFVHFGSIASAGGAIQNAWQQTTVNDGYGWARVKTISADAVVFDKLSTALQFTDAAIATAVDVLFNQFIRNVTTTSAEYLERSFQFELEQPNLGPAGVSAFMYAKGNYCNEVTFALPLTDKAVCTYGFVGTDTDIPVLAADRKTGADNAIDPAYTEAFNTSADIARLRVTDVDEDGLTTDFTDFSLTINNNVTPQKVLGNLGAAYMNTGNFDVALSTQVIFTNADLVARIRNNTTVTMDFILKNSNGAIVVDIPSLSLGEGTLEFPVNESVLMNITGMAFKDDVLDTSIGISVLPIALPN